MQYTKKFPEGKIELEDNVAYRDYSVEEMIPRVRGVLTKGMVEYGGLGFLSEGRWQLSDAVSCAHNLVKIHKCPFILGLTANGIMVAPISEKDRFLDVASCVVTKNGFWSMSDKLPGGYGYERNRKEPLVADAPARYSVRIRDPVKHVYCGILESGGRRNFRD